MIGKKYKELVMQAYKKKNALNTPVFVYLFRLICMQKMIQPKDSKGQVTKDCLKIFSQDKF